MDDKPDDLDAVRAITATLAAFDDHHDRERIIRWVREKLGLPSQSPKEVTHALRDVAPEERQENPTSTHRGTDIKSFIAEKTPTSNNELATAIAYYYRFEAPEADRKDSIASADLQDACRLAARPRLQNPGQTLINAHNVGYLDKTGTRGSYSISTVGENLVAMTLPTKGSSKIQASEKKTSSK